MRVCSVCARSVWVFCVSVFEKKRVTLRGIPSVDAVRFVSTIIDAKHVLSVTWSRRERRSQVFPRFVQGSHDLSDRVDLLSFDRVIRYFSNACFFINSFIVPTIF